MNSHDENAPLLQALHQAGLDSVDGAFAFIGGDDIAKGGLRHRRRTRLELSDDQGRTHTLFLKRYGRESLLWRIRRIMTYGLGRSPAAIEFDNIRAASQLGLPTMRGVTFGQELGPLGIRRCYIVVTAVPGTALAQCGQFIEGLAADPKEDEEFTSSLAALVRRMHESGYVHRDLYTSHIFLDAAGGKMRLHLIDLARMFKPRWRAFRWRVKDLAELKFSMPAAWVRRRWDDFMMQYAAGDWSAGLSRLQHAVDRKSKRIAARIQRKLASSS